MALLDRLGANLTESEMAQVALTRAKESIADSFSYKGRIDRINVDNIPSYIKDQMLLGQHLGKGSFSDVFEVTVTLKEPNASDKVNALLADAAKKSTRSGDNEKSSPFNPISSGSTNDTNGRRRPGRRHSMSSSVCVSSLSNVPESKVTHQSKRMTLALKCLRPRARSNFEHFLVGIEDLIHETAIFSSLEHPNIIKLWGRAGDSASLKLRWDTLQDRIDRWAKDFPNARKNPPSLSQMKVACELSDALSYLHMSNVVYRDLKPANVGFDSGGTLKLFDFGFATKIAPEGEDPDESNDPKLLYDMCGTLRYMAAEVRSGHGYGKEVDVYSFGILLWEMCALKKPFASVKSTEDFKDKVFSKGDRRMIGKYWPEDLKDMIQRCWSHDPTKRPTMQYVKSMLSALVCELKSKPSKELSNSLRGSLRMSFVKIRRVSID
ncbi:hypothetical protein ACHAXN_006295 [Cyclotella atomus]